MVTVRINTKARQHVRELLMNYKQTQKEVEELRQGIMNPHRETDENYGGGKSSLPLFEVEEKAIKLATNKQILFRAQAMAVIDDVLAHSSDQAQRIIELKYFGDTDKPKSWVAIAERVNGYSEDGCRKVERRVVDRIARQLGW